MKRDARPAVGRRHGPLRGELRSSGRCPGRGLADEPGRQYDDDHRSTLETDRNRAYRDESSMPGAYGRGPPHLQRRASADGHRLASVTELLTADQREARVEVVLAPR